MPPPFNPPRKQNSLLAHLHITKIAPQSGADFCTCGDGIGHRFARSARALRPRLGLVSFAPLKSRLRGLRLSIPPSPTKLQNPDTFASGLAFCGDGGIEPPCKRGARAGVRGYPVYVLGMPQETGKVGAPRIPECLEDAAGKASPSPLYMTSHCFPPDRKTGDAVFALGEDRDEFIRRKIRRNDTLSCFVDSYFCNTLSRVSCGTRRARPGEPFCRNIHPHSGS